jgi:eukaryotic-like serine/threonine-protein kinase
MEELRLLNRRYQLLEQLGKGGMAVVYRARDLMLERFVAIKVLREDYSSNVSFQERFRREARSAANLSHPNIVTVHDFGFDNGQLFLVMEFIPGTDLKSLVKKRGRFKVEEAIPLMIQACAGIGYAHRAGLVHCDVKPHNILVMPDMRVKVTDFGIARALASIDPEEKTDIVWGSPQYFAPEQAAGGPPSPSSDVYSLGVVFYEMLTGSLPFAGTNADDLARMHLEQEPVPIREYLPEIPAPVEQIITKVLSKEPSARYRTADQMGRVLMNLGNIHATPVLALTPETGTPSEFPTQPRSTQSAAEAVLPNPGLGIDWISVGLGLLALMAGLGLIPYWVWIYFLYNPPVR